MGIQLANAERLAMEAMAAVLEPAPPVDYLTWAERNIVFSETSSPLPGPYNRTQFPYFDEILRALSPDDPCRTVTLKGSAQLGKTVLANIFVGGSLAMDQGDLLYVHPTEENARRWSKQKLSRMIKETTCLSRLFTSKSRDGADSVTYKERVDGLAAIQISGANSPASLSMISMRRQVQDDLAKWEMNTAGDPETQADSRSRAYEFAKIFKVSTPLVDPGCRISKNFDAGSQEYPYVACPHCAEMQVLEWENMLNCLDEAKPEDACFSCVACGGLIEEHHRPALLASLEWRAHNEKAKREHRSFWIWSAYSHLQSFERIAREWLKARGDAASEKTFTNDTAGKAYKASGEAPPWEALRDRAEQSHYVRGVVPAGFVVLTLGMDCQKDRVEWQVVAWGRDFRRAVVEYGDTPGHISEPGTQEMLGGLLGQTWPNAAGRRIEIDKAAIDGNAWTEDVWAFARRHPISKLIMVRGRGEDHAPLLARVKKERHRSTGKILKYASRFYSFGTSILKMALYRNVGKADPMDRGAVLFPRGLDDEYFRQLTAERRVEERNRSGFVSYRWIKDPMQANEALDTMCQAEAAAIKFGLRGMADSIWEKLEATREAPLANRQLDLEDMMSAPNALKMNAAETSTEATPTEALPEARTIVAPPKPKAPLRQVRRSSYMG